MALGAEELVTLRDTLIRARARGVRVAQLGEERIEFRSDAEMRNAIGDLDRRIAAASSARPTSVRFSSSKGM